MTRPIRLRAHVTILMSALLLPVQAAAQGEPDLNDLVIDWSRGEFASPVMCEIDGKIVRGIRRLRISPGVGSDHRRVAILQFIDMQVEDATRCFNATGERLPNVIGKVQLRVRGGAHPETAVRDFKLALKRERGFEFQAQRGKLRIQDVAQPPKPARTVDFRGGNAVLRMVLPATDAALELADFRSPRKALLELNDKHGFELRLPIFETEPR